MRGIWAAFLANRLEILRKVVEGKNITAGHVHSVPEAAALACWRRGLTSVASSLGGGASRQRLPSTNVLSQTQGEPLRTGSEANQRDVREKCILKTGRKHHRLFCGTWKKTSCSWVTSQSLRSVIPPDHSADLLPVQQIPLFPQTLTDSGPLQYLWSGRARAESSFHSTWF